jgi:hypothetical protein
VLDGTVMGKRNGKKVASLGPAPLSVELSSARPWSRSTATVICESECTLLLLSQRHFMAVLDDVPSMAQQVAGVVGGSHPRPRPPVLR